MSCPQVGQTVFSLKNLCSLVIVPTFWDNLPLRLFSFTNLSPASVTICCSFVNLKTSSSKAEFSRRNTSASFINLSILILFSSILCFPLFSSSSMKLFCMSIFSLTFFLFTSRDLICSFRVLILSLIRPFMAEKIRISSKSSITSRRLAVVNCMKGTKVLLPRITI